MAGRGPEPKHEGQRRRTNKPARGEWLDLPPTNPAKTPGMPRAPKGGWAAGTRAAWIAWWSDPASLTWTPADIEAVRALTGLHHELERGKFSLAPEVRLRLDGLGLSQKGKRDLRLRVVDDATEAGDAPAVVELDERRSRLKVV